MNRHEIRRWNIAVFAAVLLASALGLAACSDPLAPVKPVWDVDANVPVINHTYTLEELLVKDDALSVSDDGTNILVIAQSFPLRNITLAEHLVMEDQSTTVHETVNAVHFDIPDYLNKTLDVFTLFPGLSSGSQVVQPHSNALGVKVEIDARRFFEEVVFDDGRLNLGFANGLTIPIVIDAILLQNTKGQVLGEIHPGTRVQPGQDVTIPAFDLSGVRLESRMSLGFVYSTPGSAGKAVQINGNMGVGLTGSLTETEIASIRGYLPSQELSYEHSADLNDASGLRITNGTISSGTLDIEVRNDVAVSAQFTVTIPQARINGSALSRVFGVGPSTTRAVSFDLAGATLTPVNQTGMSYFIDVVTEDCSNRLVTVHKNDALQAVLRLDGVHFSSLTGTLSPRPVSFRDMSSSKFELSNRLKGNLTYTDARMWAEVRNSTQLPMALNSSTVMGKRSSRTARIPITPTDLASGQQTTIGFTNTDVVSFLNSFSPEYPDSMGVEGSMLLNPGGMTGTVKAADRLEGTLFVEIPMRFSNFDGYAVDTIAMVMDESTRKRFTEVNEGRLTFTLENHLPTTVTIEPEILDANYQVLLTPRDADGASLQIGSAPTDASGYVTQSLTDKLEMQFSGDDFDKLAKSKWVRFTLRFASRPSGGAIFRTTDYVKVRGFATLNVSSTITE